MKRAVKLVTALVLVSLFAVVGAVKMQDNVRWTAQLTQVHIDQPIDEYQATPEFLRAKPITGVDIVKANSTSTFRVELADDLTDLQHSPSVSRSIQQQHMEVSYGIQATQQTINEQKLAASNTSNQDKVQSRSLVIYAGDPIPVPNYYVLYRNESVIAIHVIYPGNGTYATASELLIVKVLHPVIELSEQGISVRNATPGALVTVFCRIGNRTVKMLELHLQTDSIYTVFQPWLDCDYVYAVYRHRDYEQVVFANEPEPVQLLTRTCRAGEPCVLLAPSSKIVSAVVGSVPYTPGKPVALPPGVYTLRVTLSDGNVLYFTVYVAEVSIMVHTWYDGVAWRVQVDGPPWVKVKLALVSGLTIDVGVGTHTLFSEPVSAYWYYGRVEFIKYRLVR